MDLQHFADADRHCARGPVGPVGLWDLADMWDLRDLRRLWDLRCLWDPWDLRYL